MCMCILNINSYIYKYIYIYKNKEKEMTKEEFEYFCTQVNQAYPKQLVMNETEKNFMAVAIRDYTLKDCMNALALHVQKSEWRPKVL